MIVATARGMKFSSGGANPFREGGFDVHVHVFERFVPLKFSIFDVALDGAQPIVDLVPFVGRNNAGCGERGGMRD